jgi:hypothetical protein
MLFSMRSVLIGNRLLFGARRRGAAASPVSLQSISPLYSRVGRAGPP